MWVFSSHGDQSLVSGGVEDMAKWSELSSSSCDNECFELINHLQVDNFNFSPPLETKVDTIFKTTKTLQGYYECHRESAAKPDDLVFTPMTVR